MFKSTLKLVAKENNTYSLPKDTEYDACIVSDFIVVLKTENGYIEIDGTEKGRHYWSNVDLLNNFEMVDPPITVIETDTWEPVPDKPHYVRRISGLPFEEVYNKVVQFLKEREVYDELDYFYNEKLPGEFPEWRWIACYAVVGGSEGHYIHVDVIDLEGNHKTAFVGKTFLGMDHALKVSGLLTKVFWEEFK